jgi:hypothetical protein
VVTFGCATLLWVTTYSHGLLMQAHREDRELAETVWPKPKPQPASGGGFSIPERCWFAGEPGRKPVQSAAVTPGFSP